MSAGYLQTASGLGPYFNERTSAQVYIAVHQEKQIKPSDHPKLPESDPLWKFLRKCWSPDPAARPSAQEVTEEVSKSCKNSTIRTTADTSPSCQVEQIPERV